MSDGGVTLRVREARPRDVGRGIVRLPERARQHLGVLSGDTVVLEGDRATAVKVWPAGDGEREDALRIDGETRSNAGTSVGEEVRVRARPLSDAARVTVTPLSEVDAATATLESAIETALLDRPVAPDDRVRVESLGEGVEFRVDAVAPDDTAVVTDATTIEVQPPDPNGDDDRRVGTTYEDIGGLGEELALVRETVELPLSAPDRFRRLGIEPPKGVLLHGPPGTGKTLIARAVATEADAHFISVSGPEIVRKYKGESEERLRAVFEEARTEAPSVVFFDELDAIAGARDSDADMENRIVAQLLSLMDGLEQRGEVVVVGATNRVDAVDPALRRPGRFDREIEIGVPDRDGRNEILDIHTRGMPLADDVVLDRIADRTHGFVGADLQALASEAGMRALRRQDEASPGEVAVTRQDLEAALAAVDPSAMRAFVAEQPTVDYDDVGGLTTLKETLRETVVWPLTHPLLFEETGTDPPTGVLLYGPPGTGKSLLAEAVAGESGVNVLRVAGPELLDRYVGESEQSVRDLFDRARQAAPAIVFIDEIDTITGRRGSGGGSEVTDRVVSQLLTELDSVAGNPSVTVLAATNRVDDIDAALLRPGRLERQLAVEPPDADDRAAILEVHARGRPIAADVDLDDVARELDSVTGADLAAVMREASLNAIREAVDEMGASAATDAADTIEVRRRHIEDAVASVTTDD